MLTGEIIAIGIGAFVAFLIVLIAVYFQLRTWRSSGKGDDEILYTPDGKLSNVVYQRGKDRGKEKKGKE